MPAKISDKEIVEWINSVLGSRHKSTDLHGLLKDGVILVDVAKRLMSISTKLPHKLKSPFFMMENIEFFTAQCKKAGVKDENNFMTVDLYEKKNMEAVKIAIVAFARALNSSNTGVHLIGPNEMKTGEKTRDHNSSESAMTNKSVK